VVLATHLTYPQSRAYVLKLHRDSDPKQGRFEGIVESVVSGKRLAFANAEELIAIFSGDAFDGDADIDAETPEASLPLTM